MPITQDRMLALLHAAQDYRHALSTLVETIKKHEQAVEFGRESLESAARIIFAQATANVLLTEPEASVATLIVEAKHFQDHGRKNVRERLRQRKRREQPESVAGFTAPRSVAPATLISRLSLAEALDQEAELPAPVPSQGAELVRLEALNDKLVKPLSLPSTNAITEQFQADLAAEQADAALGLFGEPEVEGPISPGDYSSGKVKGQTV